MPRRKRTPKPRIGLRPYRGEGIVLRQDRDPWQVQVRFVEHGGKLVADWLEVSLPSGSPPPARGLTRTALRAIPLPEFAAEAAAWQELAERRERSFFSTQATRRLKEPRQGRSRPPEFYVEIAELYLGALIEQPRSPIKALSKRLGVTESRVRDWVRLARDYGWLTRPGQGSAGGEATEQLKQWQATRKGGT